MKMHRILALFIIFAVCQSHAHVDRILGIENGALEGLSGKYSPATFIENEKRIRIGENEVVIPDCIWNHLFPSGEDIIEISASWYHNPELLPHYIAITTKEKGDLNEITLLINLNTLRPIRFYKTITKQTGEKSFSSYSEDMPLGQECLDSWNIKNINKPNQSEVSTPFAPASLTP